MIYFFSPYAFNGHLFDAYDKYMMLLKSPSDWACMTDGDALFFQSNFGHLIKEYIDRYPETGLFTAFANRIGNTKQLLSERLKDIDSIKYHYKIARSQELNYKEKATELHGVISGFIMVIQKKTWMKVRKNLKKTCQGMSLLKVDNEISRAIEEAGLKIIRMDAIYLLHYYRMVEGKTKRGIV